MHLYKQILFCIVALVIMLGVLVFLHEVAQLYLAGSIVNSSDLKNVTSSAQSVIISAGLIIGGIWSFLKGNELIESKLQLLSYEKEIRDLVSRPNIDVSLELEEWCLPDDTVYPEGTFGINDIYTKYIIGRAKFKNIGNFPAHIKFDKPIKATKLIHTERNLPLTTVVLVSEIYSVPDFDSTPVVNKLLNGPHGLNYVENIILDPNSETTLPFSLPVRHPGMYLVEISAPIDSIRKCALTNHSIGDADGREYSAKNYILVGS